jgi:hypothetical protein
MATTRKKTTASADAGESTQAPSADDLFRQLTTLLTTIQEALDGLSIGEAQAAALDTCTDLRAMYRSAIRKAAHGQTKVKKSGIDRAAGKVRAISTTLAKVTTAIAIARAESELAQVAMKEMLDAAAEVQRQQDVIRAGRKLARQQKAQERAQDQIKRLQSQMQDAQRAATAS